MKTKLISSSNVGLLVAISYVSAQIFSNIASSKIALIGSFSIDGGTIISIKYKIFKKRQVNIKIYRAKDFILN